MVDPTRVWRPGMRQRLDALLKSDVDPYSYTVSAARLRQVIRESPGNDALKRKLLTYLERKVIKGKTTAGCVQLGSALAEFTERTDDEDIIAICHRVNDLDNLPYVSANGRLVS